MHACMVGGPRPRMAMPRSIRGWDWEDHDHPPMRACVRRPSSCVSWAFVRVQPAPSASGEATVCAAIIAPPVPASRRASQRPPGPPVKIPHHYYVGRRGCGPLRPAGPAGVHRAPRRAARPADVMYSSAGRRLAGRRSRRPHTRPYGACPACLRHVTWCPPAPASISPLNVHAACLLHRTTASIVP
jgi:hypothetical protein